MMCSSLTLFDINFQPTDMSLSQLREGYLNLVSRIYDPEFVAQRYTHFRNHLRTRIRQRKANK